VPRIRLRALAAATLFAAAAAPYAPAQSISSARQPAPDRSAALLRRSVDGLTTTARVLIVGMHPDDDLPELSTWLSLGRHVETAYLFVTRGESGEDFNGPESGPSLGVVRVGEALNARRIDGAHQYFTRAYDFGAARTIDDVFLKRVDTTVSGVWPRDSVVADVVTIVRAFRPQVIVAVNGDSTGTSVGQHQALTILMNDAFGAATDTARFPVKPFGAPWPVAKLYRVGAGIQINTGGLDRLSGRTYASLGAAVRAQQRSQGPAVMTRPVADSVQLQMIASRVNRDLPDSSLFDAVDTSFARLARGATPVVDSIARRIAGVADSLRSAIDVTNPEAVVRPLAEIAELASALRRNVQSCAHISMSAAISVVSSLRGVVCDAAELDRDAAADLIRERANDALLAAAGIEISATADRELLARLDTATVTVTIRNHGATPVTVGALSVHRAIQDSTAFARSFVAPGATVSLARRVEGIPPADPWWMGNREGELYPGLTWSRDGLNRVGAPESSLAPAVAVPEDLRRATDVSLLLDVAGATIITSIGPVLYPHADPFVGVQNRQLAGVPEVTLRFARNLEWIPAKKPIHRIMRVKIESYSDHPLVLGLGKAAEEGIIVDAIPKEVTLAPHEHRELLLPIRGRIDKPVRQQFLFWALTPQIRTYQMGYQPVERDYLEPARIPRATGAFLQGVDVTVPRGLTVFYVPEGVDDLRSTLTQIGVTAREIEPEVLLTADLSQVSTVVLAHHAVERFPEIASQANRLLDFVRKGGTLVIQRGSDTTLASKLLPFPVSFSKPAESVQHPDAPVRAIAPQSRLLTWPNRITQDDWATWPVGRADAVPTTADPRYQRVIEVHDPDQPENRNAILVAKVGKGTVIYTSLTFDEQIAGGSTGALRLFVNLLSASLSY
jgi:LmbE family N-acetylglucosaminyl deacetylase